MNNAMTENTTIIALALALVSLSMNKSQDFAADFGKFHKIKCNIQTQTFLF